MENALEPSRPGALADGGTALHSKTDPEGEGAMAYLGPATLERIRAWTDAAGIDSRPLFRRIAKGGRSVGGGGGA